MPFYFCYYGYKGRWRKVARPKKYTKKALKEAVERYFDSITREVELTEKIDSGKRDDHGHVIYDTVKITNKLGEVATATEYLVPPTLGGLCSFLKIDQSTWSRWSDKDTYPEFEQIITKTKERLLTWRQEQVLLRKDVKGLIWDMETNYGCGQKKETVPQMAVVLKGELKDYAG